MSTYVCVGLYMSTYVWVGLYVCQCVSVYVYICVYVYVYVYMCVCVCMYVWVCVETYIGTHCTSCNALVAPLSNYSPRNKLHLFWRGSYVPCTSLFGPSLSLTTTCTHMHSVAKIFVLLGFATIFVLFCRTNRFVKLDTR